MKTWNGINCVSGSDRGGVGVGVFFLLQTVQVAFPFPPLQVSSNPVGLK